MFFFLPDSVLQPLILVGTFSNHLSFQRLLLCEWWRLAQFRRYLLALQRPYRYRLSLYLLLSGQLSHAPRRGITKTEKRIPKEKRLWKLTTS
jgi:hypothetical protein